MNERFVEATNVQSPPDTRRIAMIPGDGIGPEVLAAAATVLEALALSLSFEWLEAGWGAFERDGTALPDATVEALARCDGALFGAVSSPSGPFPGYTSPIIDMRRRLDLYGNLRPAVSAPVNGSRSGIDLLIVRENTEDLYVKQESMDDNGERAVAQRVITRRASRRIALLAFEQARARAASRQEQGRPSRVTIVHKANVLPITDGLFREVCLEVAADCPDIQHEEQLVDSMAYRLIREPARYDVVVAPNLYGDILSDAAAALVGGLGLAPSANVGEAFTLAEPVHGSAPDIAGRGIANPVAAILSAALLLRALGEPAHASAIEQAVRSTLEQGIVTPDLGGDSSTDEVTAAIVAEMANFM
jgi:homoisocitrate dehydrogenase